MQIGDSRGRMRGCRRLHCKILGGRGGKKIPLWPDSFGTYFREKPREKIGCADAAVNQKKEEIQYFMGFVRVFDQRGFTKPSHSDPRLNFCCYLY